MTVKITLACTECKHLCVTLGELFVTEHFLHIFDKGKKSDRVCHSGT